ncbi:MAG: hypothetical protein ACKORY_10255 [Actinomycetota bacterium]
MVRAQLANALCCSKGPGRPINSPITIGTVFVSPRVRNDVAPNSPRLTAALMPAARARVGASNGA